MNNSSFVKSLIEIYKKNHDVTDGSEESKVINNYESDPLLRYQLIQDGILDYSNLSTLVKISENPELELIKMTIALNLTKEEYQKLVLSYHHLCENNS